MDWLGKMIGLPAAFMHSAEQTMGGGVIQVRKTSGDIPVKSGHIKKMG